MKQPKLKKKNVQRSDSGCMTDPRELDLWAQANSPVFIVSFPAPAGPYIHIFQLAPPEICEGRRRRCREEKTIPAQVSIPRINFVKYHIPAHTIPYQRTEDRTTHTKNKKKIVSAKLIKIFDHPACICDDVADGGRCSRTSVLGLWDGFGKRNYTFFW